LGGNGYHQERCQSCEAEPVCPFNDLSEEARIAFETIMEPRFYAPGSIIHRQGDPSRGIFVVRSGLVRAAHLTPGGKGVGVQVLGAGTVLGLTEVVTGDFFLTTVEAVEDCEIESVARRHFVPFLLNHPQVALALLIRVSQDLARLQAGVFEAAGGGRLTDRLLRQLQELAGNCGVPTDRGTLLDLPLTVRDLAGTLGCSRQWASKLLSEIESLGLIERDGRRIILTGAALEAEAVTPF
jgi:CRP-like cAMP-binding protein